MTDPPNDSSPILLVLLGASNLARGYCGLIHFLRRQLYPRPLQVLNALGPGRGYCAEGGIFNVVYPPIRACGIMDAVKEKAKPPCRVVALITDIGNDIMYGVPVKTITDCVVELLKTFRELDADILMTSIPNSMERDIGKISFAILRALFYPKSRVERSQAASAVIEINRFLCDSVSDRITLIEDLQDYYGLDFIHFSILKGQHAWSRIGAEILGILGIECKGRIKFNPMMRSYQSHVVHLLATDMFPMRPKGAEFF